MVPSRSDGAKDGDSGSLSSGMVAAIEASRPVVKASANVVVRLVTTWLRRAALPFAPYACDWRVSTAGKGVVPREAERVWRGVAIVGVCR